MREDKHDRKSRNPDTCFCSGCGAPLGTATRQRRYCERCQADRHREQQRQADARRRAKRRGSAGQCAGCGEAITGDPRRKYCGECANRRRSEGQQRRWDGGDPVPAVRCKLPGCQAPARPGGLYCKGAHYHEHRRGRPAERAGRRVTCDCDLAQHQHPTGWCRADLGYQRKSRIDRSGHHICATCLPDWKRRRLPRPKVPHYGVCGHVVSRPDVELCRPCWLARSQRGPYKEAAIEKTARDLASKGLPVTVSEVARRAGVSRDAVYRWRRAAPQPVVAPHPSQGTSQGFKAHLRRGETPCRECREAYRAYRREWWARRKAGDRSRAVRVDVARCGTASGNMAHRRRGEAACDACAAAKRAADAEYRSRKAGEARRGGPR